MVLFTSWCSFGMKQVRIACAGGNSNIQFLSCEKDDASKIQYAKEELSEKASILKFDKESGLLFTGQFTVVTVWKVKDGKPEIFQRLEDKPLNMFDGVLSLAFDRKRGFLFSCFGSGTLQIHKRDKETGKFELFQNICFEDDGVWGLRTIAFDKKNELLACGFEDGIIKILELNEMECNDFSGNFEAFTCLQTLNEQSDSHTGSVATVLFDENGFLFSGSSKIKVWEKVENKFKCIATLGEARGAILSLVTISDSLFASGNYTGEICIWKKDQESSSLQWKCIQRLDDVNGMIKALAFDKKTAQLFAGAKGVMSGSGSSLNVFTMNEENQFAFVGAKKFPGDRLRSLVILDEDDEDAEMAIIDEKERISFITENIAEGEAFEGVEKMTFKFGQGKSFVVSTISLLL